MGLKVQINVTRPQGGPFRPGDIIQGLLGVQNDGEKAVNIDGLRLLDKGQLGVGGFSFPFRFRLPPPPECPSSYASARLDGRVVYTIQALLRTSSEFLSNKRDTVQIPVRGVLNLDKEDSVPPSFALQRQYGRHRLEVTLPRTGCVPGDQISFTVHASKESPFKWAPVATLYREESLMIRTGHSSDVKKHILAGTRKDSAKEKAMAHVWEAQLKILGDALLTDLGGANFIKINYFLKIGDTGIDTMKMPVTIGTGFSRQQPAATAVSALETETSSIEPETRVQRWADRHLL